MTVKSKISSLTQKDNALFQLLHTQVDSFEECNNTYASSASDALRRGVAGPMNNFRKNKRNVAKANALLNNINN